MNTYLFVILTVLINAVFAKHYPYRSTFYGCPDECETQENPKCEIKIPSNKFFVALVSVYIILRMKINFIKARNIYIFI